MGCLQQTRRHRHTWINAVYDRQGKDLPEYQFSPLPGWNDSLKKKTSILFTPVLNSYYYCKWHLSFLFLGGTWNNEKFIPSTWKQKNISLLTHFLWSVLPAWTLRYGCNFHTMNSQILIHVTSESWLCVLPKCISKTHHKSKTEA